MDLARKAWTGLAWLGVVMAGLLFVPAGTLAYWQGWVFWALCLLAFGLMTGTALRDAPDLIARRMRAGAAAETRPAQKMAQAVSGTAVTAILVVGGLDRRFGWSHVPLSVVLLGDAGVLAGCLLIDRVFRANRFAASTIQVEEGQTLVDTGPYAVVRHPMYSGALPLMLGAPLALASWWALPAALVAIAAIVYRLLDEEQVLAEELPGYVAYQRRVRWRLVPAVW